MLAANQERLLSKPVFLRLFAGAACCFALALPALAQDAVSPAPAIAEQSPAPRLPLWEAGIAGAGGLVPDYPASDNYSARAVPFPFFVYRGNFFRSDENGARVRAPVNHNVELDVSGSAAFAAHNTSTGARAGMPKLNDTFELGPNLKITFARPAPGRRWLLVLPVREVTSFAGLNMSYRGLVFAPGVDIQQRHLFGSPWNGYAELGSEFATRRLQDYYYSVPPQYATAQRPAYSAHGGYFGSRLELGLNRPIGESLRLFIYGRVGYYGGAENANSPLFRAHTDGVIFAGLDWSFLKSKEMVTTAAEY